MNGNEQRNVRYLFLGDSAISIQFGEDADIRTNMKVRAMSDAIKEAKVQGITETLYTYRSLMVRYDPLKVKYNTLIAQLDEMVGSIKWDKLKPDNRVIHLPVYYRIPGTELQTVADYEGITTDEVIRIHTSKNHYIFMLGGVQPGGASLACPDGSFTIPRKTKPVLKPFSSTITMWGIHTGISSHRNIAGWYTIGYLPCELYDPEVPERPSYLEPGMWVNFFEVDKEESDRIHEEYRSGRYMPEVTLREDLGNFNDQR